MIYFDEKKGEYVWLSFNSKPVNSSDYETAHCLVMFSSSSATIEKIDPPKIVKTCEDYYALVKTTKTPFILRNCQKSKKYLWTGNKEIEQNLTDEEIPVNWDIVIAVLMRLQERGKP